MIPTLLLAAGASSRMGGVDKLLEPIGGTPLLARQAARALATGPTYVTLPSADHPRRSVLPHAARVVAAPGQMSDSIKAGIAALPDHATGVIILPADMPDITSADLQMIRAAATAPIVRATTQNGDPGHPVYFALSLFDTLLTLTGDQGAGAILKTLADQTRFVALPGNHARLDLDTPEDWAAYQAR